MADAYLGQIEIFAFGYAPRGWALCAGQTMPINQYQALFSVLGTTYGGNGVTTFNLPDLRGRLAMGQGNGQGLTPRVIGQIGGEASHTLLLNETPLHTHTLGAVMGNDVSGNTFTPGPTVALAQTTGKQDQTKIEINLYVADANPNQAMAPAAVGVMGGQPHSNMMPYLAVNFCIALNGVFPSRN